MNTIKQTLAISKTFADSFLARFYPRLSVPLVDLQNKRALVTGANIGLGKSIATSLASQGAEVHLLCRSKAKADAAKEEIITQTGNSKVFVHVIDLSSLKVIAEFVEYWGTRDRPDRKIDILMNNAGLCCSTKVTTPDGFEITYAVNMLSQFALTIPLLQHGHFASDARIIQISSVGMYSGQQISTHPTDLNSTDLFGNTEEGAEVELAQFFTAYKRSKALQVIFTMELQDRLKSDPRYPDVVVQSCHPGSALSTIWSRPDGLALNPASSRMANLMTKFLISCEEGAKTPVWLATAPEVAQPELRGLYWDRNAWRWIPVWMHDKEQRRVLWDIMARDAKMEGIY